MRASPFLLSLSKWCAKLAVESSGADGAKGRGRGVVVYFLQHKLRLLRQLQKRQECLEIM